MTWRHVVECWCSKPMPSLGTRLWMVSFKPQPRYALWNHPNLHSTEVWVNPKAGLKSLQKICCPSRHKKDDSSLVVQPPAPVFLHFSSGILIRSLEMSISISPQHGLISKTAWNHKRIDFIFIVFQSHSTRQRYWNSVVKKPEEWDLRYFGILGRVVS
jgi:hypothetical protein